MNIDILREEIEADEGCEYKIYRCSEGYPTAGIGHLLTEWDEFKNINWEKLSKMMRKPSWIFDTRDIIPNHKIKDIGVNVWKLGNQS